MDVFLVDLEAYQHGSSLAREAAEERLGREGHDGHLGRDRQLRRSVMRSAEFVVRLVTHDAHLHHLHRHRLTHHA